MRTERADVCVIGSGAGGSVVAFEAASRGLSTVLLERGPRVRQVDTRPSELETIPRLYKDGGLFMNTGLDMFILQGTCVGGSTFLSNMVMLRPSAAVWSTWAALGAELDRVALERAFDDVARELDVSPADPSNVSASSRRFGDGARALGLRPEWMMKALGACRGCGYCNQGCPFGTKRSADATYVTWAEERGARVVPETDVTELEHRGGRVTGVLARRGRGGDEVRIEARQVVVAAGAIGSSSLLLASGIRRNVGTRLSFNAGSMMVAELPEPVDGFDADQMTLYLHGDGHIIEATHNPIMSAALTTPGWLAEHGQLLARTRYLSYAGVLVPTEPTGRVVVSPFFGHEEVRFSPSEKDLGALKAGLRTVADAFFAAGARRVVLPTHAFRELRPSDGSAPIDGAFSSAREISFGSAHPQGGNPMSDDPRLGAVRSDLSVHGFENLFVADASVFPTAIGVNPIHTIMAVARAGARRFLA